MFKQCDTNMFSSRCTRLFGLFSVLLDHYLFSCRTHLTALNLVLECGLQCKDTAQRNDQVQVPHWVNEEQGQRHHRSWGGGGGMHPHLFQMLVFLLY